MRWNLKIKDWFKPKPKKEESLLSQLMSVSDQLQNIAYIVSTDEELEPHLTNQIRDQMQKSTGHTEHFVNHLRISLEQQRNAKLNKVIKDVMEKAKANG